MEWLNDVQKDGLVSIPMLVVNWIPRSGFEITSVATKMENGMESFVKQSMKTRSWYSVMSEWRCNLMDRLSKSAMMLVLS
jgi:hypothetical protein